MHYSNKKKEKLAQSELISWKNCVKNGKTRFFSWLGEKKLLYDKADNAVT